MPPGLAALLALTTGLLTGSAATRLELGSSSLLDVPPRSTLEVRVAAPAGFFARVQVESRGLPAQLELVFPGGERLRPRQPVDRGLSSISWIAETGGDYRVQIGASGSLGASVRVSLASLRKAGASERALFRAAPHAPGGAGRRSLPEDEPAPEVEARLPSCDRAALLRDRASLLERRGERSAAARVLHEAARAAGRCGDPRARAHTLSALARALRTEGRYAAASRELTRLGALIPSLDDGLLEADLWLGLGQLDTATLQMASAAGHYQTALAAFRDSGDVVGEARTLLWSALNQISSGEPLEALESAGSSARIWARIGDDQGRGRALQAIGLASQGLGRTQDALDRYLEAREAFEAIADRTRLAALFNGLAELYLEVAADQRAEEFARLAVEHNTFNPSGLAESRSLLGRALSALGSHSAAIRQSELAVQLYEQLGDSRRLAIERTRLAQALLASGEPIAAVPLFRRALAELEGVGARQLEAMTLTSLARALEDAGSAAEALACLQRALELHRAVGASADEVLVLARRARLVAASGDLESALVDTSAAIARADELRVGLGSDHLRTSYSSAVDELQELHIDLLMRLHEREPDRGHSARALEASERSRARTLAERIRSRDALPSDAGPEGLAEVAQRLESEADLVARRLVLRADFEDPDGDELLRRWIRLRADADQVRASLRSTTGRVEPPAGDRSFSLAALQAILDPDTALVEYSVAAQVSYAWVVTSDGLTSFTLPGRQQLEALVRRHRALLTAPIPGPAESVDQYLTRVDAASREVAAAARALSALAMAPALAALRAQRRIVVVADESLEYVPFAALPDPRVDPERALIESYELVRLPSATSVVLIHTPPPLESARHAKLLVVADPVFSPADPRVQGSSAAPGPAPRSTRSGLRDLARLEASGDEARDIAALAGERVTLIEGFAATRKWLIAGDLTGFEVVHFATHSVVNDENPELSAILVSLTDQHGEPKDGLLLLDDIARLRFSNALVVLSACDSALGKQIRGEGMVGMSHAFLGAGANRIIASLWKVDDRATREFMGRFYDGILSQGLTETAAVRAAQLAMASDPAWAMPYYWAGFALHGDWR